VTSEAANAVLLLSCPDQRGVVAAVAEFLYRNGGNIVDTEQHSDLHDGVFFQRVEFELEGFALARDEVAPAFGPIAERFGMRSEVYFTDVRPRVAVLASRHPHCLFDLLVRHHTGELAVEVPLVISNHPDHEELVRAFGASYHFLPVTADTKPTQEALVVELLDANDVEVVVLARYMQILTDGFIARYPNRIINIHHSFLPAFAGAKPYHQAHDRGVKVIGATAHYATAVLDEGPIIDQDVVRVSHRDDIDLLVRKGRDLETVVLARAVHAHVERRVLVHGGRTVVFGG
jgi:formyltetrahydrofolate deformylase